MLKWFLNYLSTIYYICLKKNISIKNIIIDNLRVPHCAYSTILIGDLFLEFIRFCQIEQFLLPAKTFHVKFHVTELATESDNTKLNSGKYTT